MLVLALDTSTSMALAGIAVLDTENFTVTEVHAIRSDGNKHAEELASSVAGLFTSLQGASLNDVEAIAVGVGPGPYTGLRVGIATAAALGDALGVPVYGVCSLDAIAFSPRYKGVENMVVVTDAKRKEVYWGCYQGGKRVHGPGVCPPVDLPSVVGTVIPQVIVGPTAEWCREVMESSLGKANVWGGTQFAEERSQAPDPSEGPDIIGLVTAAVPDIVENTLPLSLEPLYLRPPDAKPPLHVGTGKG